MTDAQDKIGEFIGIDPKEICREVIKSSMFNSFNFGFKVEIIVHRNKLSFGTLLEVKGEGL